MIKVKTKASGCFRSEDGAKEYLTIMSYIGSAHKQGINSHRAICEALAGIAIQMTRVLTRSVRVIAMDQTSV